MISGVLFSLVYNAGIKNITKFAVGKNEGLTQRLSLNSKQKENNILINP